MMPDAAAQTVQTVAITSVRAVFTTAQQDSPTEPILDNTDAI